MKIIVVGKKIGSFPDENGNVMNYAKLYVVTEPPADDCVYEGFVPDTYSISPKLAADIPVGALIMPTVNSKGKIIAVEVLEKDVLLLC